MVTTYPPRGASLSSPWRFAELFWPNVPSPCGLDADAARLLRSTLTMAAGQMLERWRRTGAPLPPRPDLAMISQARFVTEQLPGQSLERLLALLDVEAQMIRVLVQRPLGDSLSGQWAAVLAQQCRRIGQLYEALKGRVGTARAEALLALALGALKGWE